MISRMLMILVLGGSLASPLFAGTQRGDLLFVEAGGIPGVAGVPGIPGAIGPPSTFGFADFFALMPVDNAVAVIPGAAVEFPVNGPTSGTITRTGPSTFNLPNAGTYQVEFQVSVTEGGATAAQLQLRLGGVADPISVVGRSTGTDQLVGISYVTTVAANTILEVINPATNAAALTITPRAGQAAGLSSVSAHLIITQVQ